MQIPSLLAAVAALSAAGVAAAPTVYLCGDSTMAARGANDGATDGWGQYFAKYATGTAGVVNKAIGGRSARSYTNEGRFTEVANLVKTGDIVVIEFGHNDGGSPNKNDNGRSDCPGTGTEVCRSDKTGENVYTFVFYVVQAAKLFLGRGATVVLSSQTPNNLWEGGQFGEGAPRFVGYQAKAARDLGSAGVSFVDHFQAVANSYKRLGSAGTNALYPRDHTHTSPAGADLSAQAFAQAVAMEMNGTTSLKNYIVANYPRPY
ncbi:SGNH hydrolase-type esterase domain-containing protein [Apiospora hydei]|uniref:SGNH hydrolase-type esterase domain-containing protein n=1 Tax=Apiospora hydei TaxID=1337664 RepID=A0ABR1V703_9PEZI